ncbi:MAG: hypothetical protein KGN36_07850 [Acidobacteriota bacterium]|nr:hypothetical protein [Acidobacteriota bacterium]
MKLFGAAAAMVMGTMAWAGGSGATYGTVTACLDPGANGAMLYRAEGTATRLLARAGVRLVWRTNLDACAQGAGLVVTVSRETPATEHPGALAYARTFERTHIVLFYDRVLTTAGASVTPFLMGHVLAHEIVHMLQGLEQHSATGVMKARWGAADFADMPAMRLRFTDEDVQLVHRGIELRNRATKVAE